MVIPPFHYYAPSGMSEALDILDKEQNNALPLGGGTDILVMIKEGAIRPKGLLSLKKLEPLKEVKKREDGTIEIGAGMTVSAIQQLGIAKHNPCFADLIHEMATLQVRNRATIGGNLCTAAACADFPPVLFINDAAILLKSKEKERLVPIGEFFTGPRRNVRLHNELLVSIHMKEKNPGTAYIKFGVRNAVKISIVGIAVALSVDNNKITDIKVATTAASPTPFLVEEVSQHLTGAAPNRAAWEKAGTIVSDALLPISDLRGSAEYRRNLGRVGTVQALETAYERLMGGSNV